MKDRLRHFYVVAREDIDPQTSNFGEQYGQNYSKPVVDVPGGVCVLFRQ